MQPEMDEHGEQGEAMRLREREEKARAILGVGEAAEAEEIRRAYRRLSLVCHPDQNPSDTAAAWRFRLVCCAYKFLTEGDMCPELDEADRSADAEPETQQRLDNDWAYWCWWRDKYF
jgi:DnaJ-class molecular chaperone